MGVECGMDTDSVAGIYFIAKTPVDPLLCDR